MSHGNIAGVLLGEDLDLLAANDNVIAFGLDIAAFVGAVVAVVLQQVGVGLGVGEVVQGDHFDFAVGVALLDRAVSDAPDAAKAVDADSYCHDSVSPCVWACFCVKSYFQYDTGDGGESTVNTHSMDEHQRTSKADHSDAGCSPSLVPATVTSLLG